MARFEAIQQRREALKGETPAPERPPKKGLLAKAKAAANPEAVAAEGPTAAEVLAAREALSGLPDAERATKKTVLLQAWRPWVEAWKKGEARVCPELVSWFAVFVFDLGGMGEFLELARLAEQRGLPQVAIPNKGWKLLRLYWLKDWCNEQKRTKGSFEPYLAEEYASLSDEELLPSGDKALPKGLLEGLDYFEFYRLVRAAFAAEDQQGQRQGLQRAVDFGQARLEAGSPAKLKTNLSLAQAILAQGGKATWDEGTWSFKASA